MMLVDHHCFYPKISILYCLNAFMLHATFGMMMSNSHLCEQIHDMMRARLRKGIGIDQTDAQLNHVTGLADEMRE